MTKMKEEIGKIESTQLGYLDGHYSFYLMIDFGGTGQGFGGYALGGEFTDKVIRGVLKAVGVETWEELPGKVVICRRNDEPAGWLTKIIEIQAPAFIKDTKPFNLEKTVEALKG